MEMRGMSGELLGTIGESNSIKHRNATEAKSQGPESSAQESKPTVPSPTTNLEPSISPVFVAKKRKILSTLHPPDSEYTDKSPKGSVDAQIIDLIDDINAYDGLVTTSSCAGRVSVFLEGEKKGLAIRNREDHYDGEDSAEAAAAAAATGGRKQPLKELQVPGGKGLGGSWLFVSHEPLEVSSGTNLSAMFGMASGSSAIAPAVPRLVRYAFEPLILHVLCASLKHAQPLLAAAVNAGFRESGLQSLKILDEGDGDGPGVMVGIRSSGLGMESIVGVYHGSGEEENHCHTIVSEEYLALLVRISNERFNANIDRRERFRRELRSLMAKAQEQKTEANRWEDKESRARRKRQEGLRRKAELGRELASDDTSG